MNHVTPQLIRLPLHCIVIVYFQVWSSLLCHLTNWYYSCYVILCSTHKTDVDGTHDLPKLQQNLSMEKKWVLCREFFKLESYGAYVKGVKNEWMNVTIVLWCNVWVTNVRRGRVKEESDVSFILLLSKYIRGSPGLTTPSDGRIAINSTYACRGIGDLS